MKRTIRTGVSTMHTQASPLKWGVEDELSFGSLVSTSSGRSTGSSKHECSQESTGGELASHPGR